MTHGIKHVGIIMDGNGRWAKERGLERKEGHRAGAKTCMSIIHKAIDSQIDVLSLYAFSTENWERPQQEVMTLMDIFDIYLDNEILDFLKRGVHFRVIGDRSKLPLKTQFLVRNAERLSANNKGMTLLLAISYGGQDDIIRAIRKLANVGYDFSKITESDLTAALDTADLSPIDLIIRTSGEQRISNFMIWQAAYAEYYFTDILWPDFTPDLFSKALSSFVNRGRRYGRVEIGLYEFASDKFEFEEGNS